MRIAVFTKKTTFHKGYGGLETQNKILCEGLVSRGHKITVFSPKWELDSHTILENNVEYIFVDCVYRMGPIFGFFGTLQKRNWINRSYTEFLKKNKESSYDLVLAQSSAGLGIIRNKSQVGIPVVSISHGTIVGEYKTFLSTAKFPKDLVNLIKNTGFTLKNFFRRQRSFINGSNKVIAVSNYVKKALIDETFTNEDRIVVIPNGINPQPFFQKEFEVNRGTKIIYIGQVIRSKGVYELVEMMNDERFANYSLDIVGGGEALVELEQLVSENSNRVRLCGKKPFNELLDSYYKNPEYGVFVFPTTRAEGLPMVLVEAMFSALPVVVYDSGGVSDAVKDGETGFVINPGNIEELKLKTLNILEDSGLRNKLSKESLKNAYNSFTLEIMLNSYEKVFKEVLK